MTAVDVFGGPGFLAKASNHLGLRGYVLDTKFGPRYDVTKLFVLFRIRQDVSAGKCGAGMRSSCGAAPCRNIVYMNLHAEANDVFLVGKVDSRDLHPY